MLDNEDIQNDESFKYVRSVLDFTKNKLKNPYGADGFNNWIQIQEGFNIENISTQPYRSHCFAGTYYNSELCTEHDIRELFDEEFCEGLFKGNNLIVVGGFVARRPDCGSTGYIDLKVFSEAGETIFNYRIDKPELDVQYDIIYIKYCVEKDKIPHKLRFSFGGKDAKYWAGNYGPRFSGMFIRGYKKSYLD